LANNSRKKGRTGVAGRVAFWAARVIVTILLIGITTSAILTCFAAAYIKTYIQPYTDLNLKDFSMDLTTIVYYTDPDTGEQVEMQRLYAEENRVWVPYDEIPKDLVNATIAIEDQRFLKHQGVDWYRTAGAFVNMFLGMKDTFGGSTITQQLIKNITENDEVTVRRKILEIFRALEFERNYSKEEIMEWYLNYAYFGEGCFGVNAASNMYFGKHVSELSLAECASLIGITNNPSVYDPYINRDNNKARQKLILFEMKDQGMISEQKYEAALAEELNFRRGEKEEAPVNVYSWYVDQVITDVIDDLVEQYGISKKIAAQMVYSGGYQIFSNMDPRVQAAVDSIYGDLENLPYVSKKSGQQLQSGITVIDSKTGQVVATAGGMGEKTGSRGWSRASNSLRPPGSSIKPISVYAPALELGLLLPNSVYDDTPHMILNDSFWPINVDLTYSGLTTVYNAVRVSKNTVAVKVLNEVTPQFSYECLINKFGITSLVKRQETDGQVFSDIDLAPLALGGLTKGVSTLEMAAAFGVFANDGIYTEPTTYSKVLDSEGNVILDNTPKSSVVLSEKTVFYINNMLEGVVSSGTGTRAKFDNMTIAGKTGTTTSKKDTWFVGYTPYYVAAVWVGYDTQERVDLSINQAPVLWGKVMSKVHEGLPNKEFNEPSDLVRVTYCLDSGLLATEACAHDPRGSRVTTGSFIRGDQPKTYCTLHVPADICDTVRTLEDGTKIDYHYMAGPYCPAESVKHVSLLDYVRTNLTLENGRTPKIEDAQCMLSYYKNFGPCLVHNETGYPPWETPPPPPEEPYEPVDPGETGIPPDPGGEEPGNSGDPNGSNGNPDSNWIEQFFGF